MCIRTTGQQFVSLQNELEIFTVKSNGDAHVEELRSFNDDTVMTKQVRLVHGLQRMTDLRLARSNMTNDSRTYKLNSKSRACTTASSSAAACFSTAATKVGRNIARGPTTS